MRVEVIDMNRLSVAGVASGARTPLSGMKHLIGR